MKWLFTFTAVALLSLGCEGRELTIFETMGGGGGAGATGDVGGAGAETTGGSGGAGATDTSSGAGGQAGAGGSAGAPGVQMYGGAGMGGAAQMPPKSCAEDADCSPGWVCEKMGCDATSGFCAPWPVFCPPDPRPVCGCDGVTYWNDCIRLQSHARFAMPDQCRQTACSCEVASDCNVPDASCSHLLPPGAMCGPGMGTCWVLPSDCPKNVDSKMWHECKAPAGSPGACVDTCTAIASEKAYTGLHRGDSCP